MFPWATAHPKLLQLSTRQKELKPSAKITFKKPSNLSTSLIHFRKLNHCPVTNNANSKPMSAGCGKCSLCGKWGKHHVNMVMECSTVTNPVSKQTYYLQRQLNCRNHGIYASFCMHCPAVYVGQTTTPFKDRWSNHRTIWNDKQTHMDENNDKAALLKHYSKCHGDKINCDLTSAWKVAFLEEPDGKLMDAKEAHWRDRLECKNNFINIQSMVLPRVK